MTDSRIQTFHTATLSNNTKVWYREAGDKSNPSIVLLHGYPTSSTMFRHLIPLISNKFHVIAPDLPGFGFTEVPEDYHYSFDNLAATVREFLKKINVTRFAIYVFDYGSPVGFRLALKDPSSITGIVTQNGNAYEEALGDEFWGPIKKYWQTTQTDPAFVEPLSQFVADRKNVDDQYFIGVKDKTAIEPAAYTLDFALLQRPGQTDIQLKLFHDYQNNLSIYPAIHKFLKAHQIPVLAAWGKNDYIFTSEGAEAFGKHAQKFKLNLLDSGHFALETHVQDIAHDINTFLYDNIAL
ncbi:hypothetical protein KDRO_A06960 [Kluyveromyces lactis]|nr:hypothetical protein KDRO_A06960 [Kluyveromyces lactis]